MLDLFIRMLRMFSSEGFIINEATRLIELHRFPYVISETVTAPT
jgi:hypothetical protein